MLNIFFSSSLINHEHKVCSLVTDIPYKSSLFKPTKVIDSLINLLLYAVYTADKKR
jgi:hypothetical protein